MTTNTPPNRDVTVTLRDGRDAIEEELDLLEALLLTEADPARQMRLALSIQSRRLQLEAEAQP